MRCEGARSGSGCAQSHAKKELNACAQHIAPVQSTQPRHAGNIQSARPPSRHRPHTRSSRLQRLTDRRRPFSVRRRPSRCHHGVSATLASEPRRARTAATREARLAWRTHGTAGVRQSHRSAKCMKRLFCWSNLRRLRCPRATQGRRHAKMLSPALATSDQQTEAARPTSNGQHSSPTANIPEGSDQDTVSNTTR